MSSDDRRSSPIDAPALPSWLARKDRPVPSRSRQGAAPITPDTAPLRQSPPQTPDTVPLRKVKPLKAAPEDPRALAQRLAREAKARIAATPEPPATQPVSAAPPEPAAPAPPKDPAPPAQPKRRGLAARAPQAARPRSAKEALRDFTPAPADRREPPATPAPAPKPQALPPAEIARAIALIARLLPGSQPQGAPQPITDRDAFRAAWAAHRDTALKQGELPHVATAAVLLDAADRVPPSKLLISLTQVDGVCWAAWIDAERQVLLGLASPGERYLAGT